MNTKNHSKVGSVSTSTINFNSWASTPVTAAVPKSKKTKKKEVVNEIFLEYAKVTEDPFWVERFNLAAIGKFPANFYYHDNTLTYKKGAKNNKLIFSSNIRESALAFINFLRTNKSIFSPSDYQSSVDTQFNRVHSVTTIEALTWETASKKIKECLISYFIVDMTKMMDLTIDQSDQLRKIIDMGIFSNLFNKTNITLNNNRIFSINGLYYDPQNKIFYIDPNLVPSTNRSYVKKKPIAASKDTIPQFNLKWDKYINKYIEQIDKQYSSPSSTMSPSSITDQSLDTETEED